MQTTISDRLQIMLCVLNLNQKEFANKVGLTEAAISRYLNGSRMPNATHIRQIADSTGVNPSWILGYGSDNQIVFLK